MSNVPVSHVLLLTHLPFFLCAGPVLGFPLQGVQTVIQHVGLEPGTSAAMVSACVSRCMLKVLKHYPVSIIFE